MALLVHSQPAQGHTPCVSLGEVVTLLPAGLPEPAQQLLDLVGVRAGGAQQVAALQEEGLNAETRQGNETFARTPRWQLHQDL